MRLVLASCQSHRIDPDHALVSELDDAAKPHSTIIGKPDIYHALQSRICCPP